jgi:transposase
MDGIEKELDRDGLIALVLDLRREVAQLRAENEQLRAENAQLRTENEQLRKRVAELEGRGPTPRLDESYSLKAEEQRMDKVCALLKFFWNLELSKSQADALLNQLARQWETEFDALCQLLAVSAVVHADETSWSINSVWALLSEQARLLIFGCRKDGETLAAILPKETFAGILVSDDAAVYRDFNTSQKCWAHLIRKAIRLTLLEPENTQYRAFLDGLLEIYSLAKRAAADQRLGDAGRQRRVNELTDRMCDLCGERYADESVPTDPVEKDFFNLVQELVRLLGDEELFTFVLHPEVDGTNNEAERTLRNPGQARDTGRTSKTAHGARRRTILHSVFESLRLHLEEFTLSAVLSEVLTWLHSGESLFRRLVKSSGLSPPATSPLQQLVPKT